jgi:photosystem II stability/assembly factor-like uncharacterized protein
MGIMKNNLCQLALILLVGTALILVGSESVVAAKGVLDPLHRPAMLSKLAEKSVLLAVTSAGKRLVAVGEHGVIVLSDDDGSSWYQATVPVSVTLTAVRFVTPESGWALGHSGIVLHSDDGGRTWVKQLDGKQAAQLALQAVQAREKASTASPEELKRSLTAAELLVSDGPDKPFLDLYFENEQKGFIVGAYNLIFYTEDGGKTWQPWLDHVENPRGMHLYGIRPEGNDIFLAGEQGTILRSENGGERFTALPSPYDGSFFGLLSLKDGGLLVFGLRGHVFRSVDHGTTWEAIHTGISSCITAATRLHDGTILLTTGTGDVLASNDKGITFKHLPIDEPFPFAGLAETENGNLVLVGMRGVKLVVAACRLAGLPGRGNGESK